ncbi:MAG: glycoside hydrolase family 28 protein [Clostridiales bacterium]|nr:glycoside hydrolase family 28 protein [Clostridiales bacterium]
MKFFKPFTHPTPPVIPQRRVSITDFGAIEGGEVLNREAINKAIDAVSQMGGGHVDVPQGVWLTGAINFKSNVDLHIHKGAELLFTADPKAYLPAVFTRIEGIRCYNYSPLLYANGCENISVTGEGKLNGQGHLWWGWALQNRVGMDDLYLKGKLGTPVEERVYDNFDKWALRPYFLQFVYCKNILIEGVRFIQSPFWCVAPLFSENIIIRNVSWFSARNGANTDSVDIDSCRNCLVENCRVDSSSDDGVCVKSGRDNDGIAVNWPTENVEVRNCYFSHGGCGVVVGSETSGGIRNVYMHDCVCEQCNMAVHVKSAPGRGGEICDIDIENIKADRTVYGVCINTHYWMKPGDAVEKLPDMHDISLKNVHVEESRDGLNVRGHDCGHIRNIYLEDVSVGSYMTQQTIDCVDNLTLNGVSTHVTEEFDWRAHSKPIEYHD